MSTPSFTSCLRGVGLAAAALALWACIGGTGTDTENGVTAQPKDLSVAAHVTDADGYGLPDVVLTLRRPGFRPDSGAAPETLLDSARELRTNSAGDVKFAMAHPGKYVVEGVHNGAILFFDTLAVVDSNGAAAYTFRSHPSRNFKGTVRLASGLRIDSGVIFVSGTGLSAPVIAGTYDLGGLPAEVALMSVGLRYRASAMVFRVAEQNRDTLGGPLTMTPTFACREITADSAAHLPAYAFATVRADTGKSASLDSPAAVIPKLDSERVKAAAQACDSLLAGTVVTVKASSGPLSPLTGKDTVSVAYVAVGDQSATSLEPRLLPLFGCVEALGTQSATTFDVQLLSVGTAVVGDIKASCR